jgi:hypothetical protein
MIILRGKWLWAGLIILRGTAVNGYEQDWYWRLPSDSVGGSPGEWRPMNQSSSLAMVLPIQGVYCFSVVLVGLLISAEVGAIVCKFFLEASLHGTETLVVVRRYIWLLATQFLLFLSCLVAVWILMFAAICYSYCPSRRVENCLCNLIGYLTKHNFVLFKKINLKMVLDVDHQRSNVTRF